MAANERCDFSLLCLTFPRLSAVVRHFYWEHEVAAPALEHFRTDESSPFDFERRTQGGTEEKCEKKVFKEICERFLHLIEVTVVGEGVPERERERAMFSQF